MGFRSWAIVLAVGLSGFTSISPAAPIPTHLANSPAEDRAVMAVVQLGGKVKRDEKKLGKPVVEVNLSRTDVTDFELKRLAPLQGLLTLSLWKTKLTDVGLRELKDLTNLTTLDISGTEVSDAGLQELALLKNLTTLEVNGTQVTQAGVAELQKSLPKCKIMR
jgi:internalin A